MRRYLSRIRLHFFGKTPPPAPPHCVERGEKRKPLLSTQWGEKRKPLLSTQWGEKRKPLLCAQRGEGLRTDGVRLTGLLLLLVLALSACAPAPAAEALPTDIPTAAPSPTATIVWFPPTPTRAPAETITVVPTPEMRPAVGQVTLEDNFDGSQPRWPTARTGAGSIAYGNNELTLAVSQEKGTLVSLSQEPTLSDFYLEITTQASLCRGEDMYGLLLRASSEQDFYRLLINCSGYLRLERATNGKLALVQDWTPSGQVPPGSPLQLRVGVWAVGDEMRIFINDVFQFSASDPIYASGRIGLFARSAGSTPLTVSFSDLVVRAIAKGSRNPFLKGTPTPHIVVPPKP